MWFLFMGNLSTVPVGKRFPWDFEALNGAITEPAWRSKPSRYLVAKDDLMIPPPAQRFMAERAGAKITEASGSHSIYVSNPETVASLIIEAAAIAEEATN